MIFLNEGISLNIDGIKSSDIRDRRNFEAIEFHYEIDAATEAQDWKWLSSGGFYNCRGRSTWDSWLLAEIFYPRTPPLLQSVLLLCTCTTPFRILFWNNHSQVPLVFQSGCVPDTIQSQENRPLWVSPVEIGHKLMEGGLEKGWPTHSSDYSTNFKSSKKALLASPRSSLSKSSFLALSMGRSNYIYYLWNSCSPHSSLCIPRGKDSWQFLFLLICPESWHVIGSQKHLLNERMSKWMSQ